MGSTRLWRVARSAGQLCSKYVGVHSRIRLNVQRESIQDRLDAHDLDGHANQIIHLGLVLETLLRAQVAEVRDQIAEQLLRGSHARSRWINLGASRRRHTDAQPRYQSSQNRQEVRHPQRVSVEGLRDGGEQAREERRLLLLPRSGLERSLTLVVERREDHLIGDAVPNDSL